jgi:hypothetical protein
MEANLTSLVYGADKACYSLRPGELLAGVAAYLSAAGQLLGDVPDSSAWDVHRLDPSQTYALPAEFPVPPVVLAAHRAFLGMATPRQVVSLHNDQTATFRLAGWRSVMVYDKGAEARAKGIYPAAPNLLRIEQRIRPRNASGEWEAMKKMTLAQLDEALFQVKTDSVELLGHLAQKLGASSQLIVVQTLMRGGASLNTALRLATVIQLHEEFGPAGLTMLGGAESTVFRWRAEVRKYMKAAGDEQTAMDESLPDLLAVMVPAFAADHEVTVKPRVKP